MKIRQVAIDKVTPYPGNPRRNHLAVDPVAASIAEFGFQQPIVVDSDMIVIVGHTRLQAAKQLGLETVPVTVATDLTPAQVQAYRIADNRTAENAEWDIELLTAELEALDGEIDLGLTGFNEAELALYFEGAGYTDPTKEWEGMPEFTRKTIMGFKTIPIHFVDQAAMDAFAELIGQKVDDKTRFLWYPKQEHESAVDKLYDNES